MRLVIHGAGGHAKVVLAAALDAGHEIVAVIGLPGGVTSLLGHPVVESADGVESDGFIVGIGDNSERKRVFEECVALGETPVTVVHPSCVVGPEVKIGAGAFLAPGVVVNVGAVIGENAIVNTGATVDHDSVVGSHAHVGPGCNLCGATRIGEGALMGVGGCVIPQRSVGDWSVVGAGAAVVSDLDAGGRYAGVPARSIATER